VLQATASWLASSRCVSAMMDLSDGLASDLPEICRESRLGAVVEAGNIPVAECLRGEKDAIKLALCGGEDYHLLFTVMSGRRESSSALQRIRNHNARDRHYASGRPGDPASTGGWPPSTLDTGSNILENKP